jgi:hypothetical protein
MAELEHVADLYRRRDMGDPEIVARAAVNAHRCSDVSFHRGIVTPKMRVALVAELGMAMRKRASPTPGQSSHLSVRRTARSSTQRFDKTPSASKRGLATRGSRPLQGRL